MPLNLLQTGFSGAHSSDMSSGKTGPLNIRNVAIVAHVDHGKTTLVDQLLRHGGAFRENEVVVDCAMDSMDQEKERGITIKSKNTSVRWQGGIINIVDTPGHADFGGEVERVMKMVDGVLLVVDAQEGPRAQTRFVLRKALAAGLNPVVFVNKLDRPNARPLEVHDLVLELFLDLDATDDQFNAPFLYGSARDGYAMNHPDDDPKDMTPLFEAFMENIPPPDADPDSDFKMLVSNIDWSDYVGRIAIGKIAAGSVKLGDKVWRVREGKKPEQGKVTKILEYRALGTNEAGESQAGHIVGLAGFEDAAIGETVAANEETAPIPFVEIDPPTVQMFFSVNDGPFCRHRGKPSHFARDPGSPDSRIPEQRVHFRGRHRGRRSFSSQRPGSDASCGSGRVDAA